MRVFSLLLALAAFADAQTPVRTPAACTLEAVQKLDLSCSAEEPCPLYLELTDAEIVAERIVLAGNIHTADATLESLLLVSDDSGKTWTEAHARIPGAALTTIQFLDFEAGWISGHVLQPDARDPFLMITSDGGKTWRKRPVYSEAKTGSIEHFRFNSRTSGHMTVDRGRAGENGLRYELWESFTGGDGWNIKQVDSKPIPFPGGDRAAVKPLRIRADAGSKSFRVEKQDGRQWHTLASFTVAVGQCKPEAPELKEPPPEPETPVEPPRSPPSLSKPKQKR